MKNEFIELLGWMGAVVFLFFLFGFIGFWICLSETEKDCKTLGRFRDVTAVYECHAEGKEP